MIYATLFLTFFKIGAFTFGGGYAMLPLIETEILAYGWMALSDLVNFVAVSESTPGPFAVNISTYIGVVTGGFFGSFCATLGVVLPSFLIILIVAHFYRQFQSSRIVRGVMAGLRPAVVGLIGASVLSVASTVFLPEGFKTQVFTDPTTYIFLAIFVLSAFLLHKKAHPILVIILSACLGIVCGLCGVL